MFIGDAEIDGFSNSLNAVYVLAGLFALYLVIKYAVKAARKDDDSRRR